MGKICFGIDVGGTTIKIGIFTEEGRMIDTWEIPTRKEDNGSHILEDVAAAVEKAIEDNGFDRGDVVGVGLGIPGPVTDDGVVLGCVNLGWDITPAATILNQLLGFPVKVGNDANVAALGEQWQGGGKGHDNMVMVTLGTGVGGGIVIDGKILAGINGAAGEIGHIPVDFSDDAFTCGCGLKGCLETLASATGIVNLAKRYIDRTENETAIRKLETITAKDVFDLAKDGDAGAKEVVDQMVHYLGNALAAIGVVINPEVFVIGGGVSKAGQYLVDLLEEDFNTKCFHALKNTEFALATLGNSAGVVGAARLVLQ